MATLIIQESSHFNDSAHLTITTDLVSLVVAECYHLHDVDGLPAVGNTQLVVAETWHDHVLDGEVTIEEVSVLVIAEAYHAHAADTAGLNIKMWTSSVDPPKLPTPTLEAQGEVIISATAPSLRLPGLLLSMTAGFRCGVGRLADLGISATGSSAKPMNLDKRLPTMSLSARSGAICGDMRIPVPELTMEVIGDLVGRLTRSLPGFTISATGSSPFTGTLNKRLPPLSLSISMSVVTLASLVGTLPTLKLSGTASLNDYGTLNKKLPSIIVSSITGHRSSIDMAMVLPTLIMASVGTGGVDAGSGRIYNEDRFEDYVLRYSRA